MSENQELCTSKSVKYNKTLVEVRLRSTKEALSKETNNNKVVKTESMLLKGKYSAENCQFFVRGNISSTPKFISIIQAADIDTILKQNKKDLIRAINQAAYTVKDQKVKINKLRVTVTLQKQQLKEQNKQIAYLKAKVKALKDLVYKRTRPEVRQQNLLA